MKDKVLLLILIFSMMTLTATALEGQLVTTGNSINAASCNYADVKAAYDSASNGDTVFVPSGSCDWGSNGLTISKTDIILMGAGIGNTVISGNGDAIKAGGESANGLRVTGIEFRGFSTGFTAENRRGVKNFRVDNSKFMKVAIFIQGDATGVFDHNIFEDVSGSAVTHFGNDDESATFPFQMGTSNAVFFEDNLYLINNICPSHFIASRMGSRYVIRHNTFTFNNACGWSDVIDAHGNCEGNQYDTRGSFTWEVYSNTFDGTAGINGRSFHFRGGQGMFYDNTVESYVYNSPSLKLTDYRIADDGTCFMGGCTEYPCMDQITQTYLWGNTVKGSPLEIKTEDEYFIKEGRDYFECSSKQDCKTRYGMEYIAYTYPHPLVTGSPAPIPIPTSTCVDNDGDGYGTNCNLGSDCNDNNANNNPGRTEICGNGLDDDCIGGDAVCETPIPEPTPQPGQTCTLSNAVWSTTGIIEGDIATLTVSGSNCDGKRLGFVVWEDDTYGDDAVNVNPTSVVFSGGVASTSWTAEWQKDWGDPEYYFIATQTDDTSNKIESNNQIIVKQQIVPSASQTRYFVPEKIVEAEAGELISPMISVSDSSGNYVKTDSGQGSVGYTFNIIQEGDYILQAKVLATNDGFNSFYIGLDNDNADGNNIYTYDTIISNSWKWDDVSLRDSTNTFNIVSTSWHLTSGIHTFKFYGREPNTKLDQLILKPAPPACIEGSYQLTNQQGDLYYGAQKCVNGVWTTV